MIIGKIVKSNSHIDYVCQVYGPNEKAHPPAPSDFRFGTFVRISLGQPSDGHLVGVIYNTILMNPEFGNLGPRLSPMDDLEIFSPDYLVEKAVLLGILAIGWVDGEGGGQQGVPPLAGAIDAMVEPMTDEEVAAFHRDRELFCMRYAPLLMSQDNPLATGLLLEIIRRLRSRFPEEHERLSVLRANLAWRSYVEPMG